MVQAAEFSRHGINTSCNRWQRHQTVGPTYNIQTTRNNSIVPCRDIYSVSSIL